MSESLTHSRTGALGGELAAMHTKRRFSRRAYVKGATGLMGTALFGAARAGRAHAQQGPIEVAQDLGDGTAQNWLVYPDGRRVPFGCRYEIATGDCVGPGATEEVPAPATAAPTVRPATIEILHAWGPGRSEANGLEEVLARFKQHAPQVTVQHAVAAGPLLTAVQTAVAAGTPPDVSFSVIVQVPAFAPLVDPIERLLRRAPGWSLDDYFDGARRAMSYQDVMIAANFNASALVTVYNQNALERIGLRPPPRTWSDSDFWTWQTFNQYAERLTSRVGGETTQWGWGPQSYFAHHPFYFQQLLWQAGGEWLDPRQLRPAFHEAAGQEALSWWLDQIQGRRVTPPVEWVLEPSNLIEAPFLSGTVAMTQTQPERMPALAQAGFPWVTALPPRNRRQAAVLAGFGWVILKDAKQKEAATEFVRFASLPEQLVAWGLKAGAIPPRKSAVELPEWQQFQAAEPNWQAFAEALQMGKSFPTVPGWADAQPPITAAIRDTLEGKIAPRAALEDAARQVDAILARARDAAR